MRREGPVVPRRLTQVEVLIDDQIFLMNSRGGISRYFAELIREFREHPEWGVNVLTTVHTAPNQHLRDIDTSVRDIPLPEASLGWKAYKGFARLGSSRRERRLTPDIVHSTYYRPEKLNRFPGVPHVVTVHDMAPELLSPDMADQQAHMAKRDYVERADAIICVSEATRDTLFEVWGPITDRPVIITAHAVSARFSPFVASADEGFPYLFHVGRREGYKNFETLLRAYARSSAPSRGVRLLTVGGGPLTTAELALASQLQVADLVVSRTATEDELPGLYRGARALVYPSTLEGFGIPVLEAMSSGCPALLADIPVFREVAGDAARYFSPDDILELSDTIDEVLSDPQERRRLREAGLTQASKYSWTITAEQTSQLYRLLLDNVR